MNEEQTTENRMPTGGELLGEVVDMLNMMEIYEEDSWKRNKRTARRYLRGETLDDSDRRVAEETKATIQRRFVDAMIPENHIPVSLETLVRNPREFLYDLIQRSCQFWTRVAATMNGKQYRPHDGSLAYYGPARLATVELAFRWGAVEGIRQHVGTENGAENPTVGAEVDVWFLDPDAFEAILDEHWDGTVAELADALPVTESTLYSWKSGNSTPGPPGVSSLAEALARHSESGESQIATKLRFGLLVSRVHQKLRNLLGDDRVEELRDVFWLISGLTSYYMAAGTGEDGENTFRVMQCLLWLGVRSKMGMEVASDVTSSLMSDDVNRTTPMALDLVGVLDWGGRLAYWDQVAFEVDTIRGTREWPEIYRLTGGLLDDVEEGEQLRRRIVANEYATPIYEDVPSSRTWNSVPDLVRPVTEELPDLESEDEARFRATCAYVAALSTNSIDNFSLALEQLYNALEELPNEPFLLERYGWYLFEVAMDEESRDKVKRAFDYLHEADSRSYKRAMPRFSMARMMMGLDNFDEAERYLRRLEDKLGGYSAFHGVRGFNFYWMGDYQRAVDSLEKSLELAPGFGATHAALAHTYMKLGEQKQAQKYQRNDFELIGIDEPEEPVDQEEAVAGLTDPRDLTVV